MVTQLPGERKSLSDQTGYSLAHRAIETLYVIRFPLNKMKVLLESSCESWDIYVGENNGFKQLNAQTNCDHVYTHEEHAFEALMLLIFIVWNLLLLFNLEDIRGGYEGVKWTLDFHDC